MNNQSISKALDMPANLFSNLGGKSFATKINEPQSNSNIVKTNNELAEDMKEYYQNGDIKLNKLSNQKQYRNRLNKMYESLKGLSPIDSEVKDTLFTSNYIEKGIVIKPTIEEMKQFWTEYRLMNNEKTKEQKRYNNPTSLYTNKESDEFDVLFDKLTNNFDYSFSPYNERIVVLTSYKNINTAVSSPFLPSTACLTSFRRSNPSDPSISAIAFSLICCNLSFIFISPFS